MKRRPLAIATLAIASVLLLMSAVVPTAADAQYQRYEEGFTIIPEECINQETGTECGLNSFVQLFVNLAQVGLKLLPYVAMIMIIWAGYDLIMAGGNTEKVAGGKKFISSILLGVLIVTILAWTWSYFVVFILTGSGNVFPNYPWQTEFWGGGEVAAPLPGAGCCVIDPLGCTDLTQEECSGLEAGYAFMGATVTVNWQGEHNFCSGITQCQNYQYGCCVPHDPSNTTCYNPNERGCLDYPSTGLQTTACTNMASCIDIEGEATQSTTTGCCVTGNSCTASSNSECFGTFLPGQNCSEVTECTIGCCVGSSSCSNGKINCAGTWDPAACDQPPNDTNCTIGCCIDTNNPGSESCYTSETVAGCDARTGSNFIFNPGFPDCQGNVECFNGCCTANNCSAGNIDGSCSDPVANYDSGNTCSALTACDVGCCWLGSQSATACLDGFERKDCEAAGDFFFNGFDCSARTECTRNGCCRDASQGNICLDFVAEIACQDFGDTFWQSQDCVAAGC